MKLGMVGLGRMGGNMTTRLIRNGHEVVAFDPSDDAVGRAEAEGAIGAHSLEELVKQLDAPRVAWIMVPAGKITEDTVENLRHLLQSGDIVVDGGNSNFRDTTRRAEELAEDGIRLLDAGTSGGVWGLDNGYCLMVGGEREAFDHAEPVFAALAPENGYAYVGDSGAGHFVKMVHNGIEYGMLAAYGEGFEIMKASDYDLNLPEIAGIWRYGSVVRSWLLELLVEAFQKDPKLDGIRGYVEDSGEGRWTVIEAIEENVPAPIAALSLFMRFASRQEESYSAKVIAALRQEFGGHAVKPEQHEEPQERVVDPDEER
jgi:6-phosphogluconate dehydrogenase